MMKAFKLGPVLILASIGLVLLLNKPFLSRAEPNDLSATQEEEVQQQLDPSMFTTPKIRHIDPYRVEPPLSRPRPAGYSDEPSLSPIFEETRENVTKMPYDHWRDVSRIQVQFQALATGSLATTNTKPSKHPEELITALKLFLAYRLSLKKAPLLELYQEHVIDSCKDWLSQTERALTFFGFHTRRNYWTSDYDCYVDSMSKAKFCEYIIENDQVLRENLRLEHNEIEEFDEDTKRKLFDSRMCGEDSIELMRDNLKRLADRDPADRDYFMTILSICRISLQDEVNGDVMKMQEISDEYERDLQSLISWRKAVDRKLEHSRSLPDVIEMHVNFKLQDAVRSSNDKTLTMSDMYQKHVVKPCTVWLDVFVRLCKTNQNLVSYINNEDCYYGVCKGRGFQFFQDHLNMAQVCADIVHGKVGKKLKWMFKPKSKWFFF